MSETTDQRYLFWSKKKREIKTAIEQIKPSHQEESVAITEIHSIEHTQRTYLSVCALLEEIASSPGGRTTIQAQEVQSFHHIATLLRGSLEKTVVRAENAKRELDMLVRHYAPDASQDSRKEHVAKIVSHAQTYLLATAIDRKIRREEELSTFYCDIARLFIPQFEEEITHAEQEYLAATTPLALAKAKKSIDSLFHEVTKRKDILQKKCTTKKEKAIADDASFPFPTLVNLVEEAAHVTKNAQTYLQQRKKIAQDEKGLDSFLGELTTPAHQSYAELDEKLFLAIEAIQCKREYSSETQLRYLAQPASAYNRKLREAKQLAERKKQELLLLITQEQDLLEATAQTFDYYQPKGTHLTLYDRFTKLNERMKKLSVSEKQKSILSQIESLQEKICYFYGISAEEHQERSFPTAVAFIEFAYQLTTKVTASSLANACALLGGYVNNQLSFRSLAERVAEVKSMQFPSFSGENLVAYQSILSGMRQY